MSKNIYFKKYQQWFICSIILIAFSANHLWAKSGNNNIDYSEFFSEYQNFYLFHPNLIKKTFWGLETRINPTKMTRRMVEKKVFGCFQSHLKSSCYYDQYLNDQKIGKIPKVITVPVVFLNISKQNLGNNRHQIHLNWEPESVHSPIISKALFLEKANLAENSPYYQIKPGIKKIKFNLVLPKALSFILDRKSAKSLLAIGKDCEQHKCTTTTSGVYKNIPDDYKDKLYLIYKKTDYSLSESTISINMHLKVVKLKLNHQFYRVFNQ